MTDEHLIENAQRAEEQQLEARIQAIKNQAGSSSLQPLGHCYDCGEDFAVNDATREKRKFCDKHCETSWNQWYQAQVRRHGPGFKPQLAC